MNINTDDIDLIVNTELSIKILNFLQNIQKQLINYNSIRVDDLKKINAIAYGQATTQNTDSSITNLLIDIQKNINQDTRVYDYSQQYEYDYHNILLGFLNSRLIEEIN